MAENQNHVLHSITDFNDAVKPKYECKSSENVEECYENDNVNDSIWEELYSDAEKIDSKTLLEASSSTTGSIKHFQESHSKIIYITLEEMYGCKVKEICIKLSRQYMRVCVDDFLPCHPFYYNASIDRKWVRFQIDKSFRDGKMVKIIERVGIQGGILDLTVTFSIKVKQHCLYSLVQDNLYVNVDISWKDALLGRCPGFRFLDNEIYKFSADQEGIIANDSIWEIPKKGMTEHGNLYIKFSVTACSNTGKEKKVDHEIASLLVCDIEQIPEDDERVRATVMS